MGINIGKRDFTLPISKIWYNKIKNQGEKMLQVLFNPTEKRSNHKAVLIIEFNKLLNEWNLNFQFTHLYGIILICIVLLITIHLN